MRRPATTPAACILVVPPFAEEMNKCRRMVTEVSLGLVEHGVATIVPDLYGTGDSGGDFSDGDLSTWQNDLATAASWAADAGAPVSGLLAVRFGCALAAAAASAGLLGAVQRTVFWQPSFEGRRVLSQFLRLRVAAGLMEDRQETIAVLRQRLTGGEIIEVAGYGLSGQLAAEVEALAPPQRLASELGHVSWYEIVRESEAERPMRGSAVIDRSRLAGREIAIRGFHGEPFWASTEIVRNAAMVSETISTFRLWHRDGR